MRDALRQFHIRSCVRDALSRHGMARDTPLRARLEADATIAAGTDSRVIMKSGNSLDAEIENACSSPRPAAESFPTGSRTVAKSDTDGVRIHFADIAAGKVRVE
ncbi:MAG: hypothetical protein WCF73_08235 [Candidatus Sulfotelmatobacter sp.]|jgi:hypothetical protein